MEMLSDSIYVYSLKDRVKGFFQLLRPVFIITAISDVWAGFAISGILYFSFYKEKLIFQYPLYILFLTFAISFLTAGSIFLLEYFSYSADLVDYPNKPLPKGIFSKGFVLLSGFLFLVLGIILATMASWLCGLIALFISILSLFYNVYGRHHYIIGPINMGIIKAVGLSLGMSLVPSSLFFNFAVLFLPFVYIAAVSSIVRFEFLGISRLTIQLTGWLYLLVILYLFSISLLNGNFLATLPFICFFFYQILVPITKTFRYPSKANMLISVNEGLIAIIILNACLAATFSGILLALIILALYPVAKLLLRFYPLL